MANERLIKEALMSSTADDIHVTSASSAARCQGDPRRESSALRDWAANVDRRETDPAIPKRRSPASGRQAMMPPAAIFRTDSAPASSEMPPGGLHLIETHHAVAIGVHSLEPPGRAQDRPRRGAGGELF